MFVHLYINYCFFKKIEMSELSYVILYIDFYFLK